MGRRVRCAITKEYGNSDEFIKIGNKYYKSQEVYDIDHKQKSLWNGIIRFICEDLLGYQKGQVYPTLINRKLKELDFYDREVILKTFQLKKDDILYQLNQDGKFKDDNGRIFYMFAIINNCINDVNKEFKRSQIKPRKDTLKVDDLNILENTIANHNIRDISTWLEEDEL